MNPFNIVVLDGERTNPGDLSWAPLEALGNLTVYPHTAPEELADRAAGQDILVLDKLILTRELLTACPSVKLIVLFATGFNHIDVKAARELGITVCNADTTFL